MQEYGAIPHSWQAGDRSMLPVKGQLSIDLVADYKHVFLLSKAGDL